MALQFFNTLGKEKQEFKPIKKGTMFVNKKESIINFQKFVGFTLKHKEKKLNEIIKSWR